MISAAALSYTINGTRILDDVSFAAERGEFIAIVGPNGAGKSSLLTLLANEVSSQENKKISLKNRLLSEWKSDELAFHKAKFSQHYSQDIPLLVKDVVLMGRYPYFDSRPQPQDLESVDKMMQETDVIHLQNRDYTTLSGGEKQRVHLARVLVQLENEVEHKILFLDEPLNNLDIRHQHNTLQLLKKFTQQKNVAIVVLHDLNLAAEFADRIFLMKDGKLLAEGKADEVFQPQIIEEAYHFPCTIGVNPVNQKPLIIFGN